MPKASHSEDVRAPVEVVWRLLVDKIENPGAYIPGVESVEIVKRQPGFVVRRMRAGGIEVTERITAFPERYEVDFVLLDHPIYAGQAVNRIEPPFRPGLACKLTFALDWRRKDGQADEEDFQSRIAAAVERTKALAEAAAR